MIKVLDKSVAELIAAGEVIERPASVVKELIENAIDANAKSITVEIKNGGITFLRISDNGKGIPYEQCPTAFLRHATSKVSTQQDLNSISTLGFRGEALASVAAVSRVSLLTKTAGSKLGTSYKIEGGTESEHSEAGCPDGTTITIRELFFNTPARLKFLKKDVTESNYVQSVVDKAALINPHISFRFIRDNKLVRVTPGDGELYSAIYAIYGKSFAASMIPVDYESNGISVSGYISQPLFCKSNRTFQSFYVNSRYVRSSTFVAALEEAYRNSIMTGKFPACVLNVTTDPSDVDANVHPAKTEVRFTNDRAVFSAVHHAARNGLLNDTVNDTVNDTEKPPQSEQQPEFVPLDSAKTDYVAVRPQLQPITAEFRYINPDSFKPKEKSIPNQEVLIEAKHEQIHVLGELFSTYIVCEQNDELVLIDKHAADEKIRFEQLKSELKSHSQLLLEPVKIRLDIESCEALAESAEDLLQMGLRLEADGDYIRVLAMPTVLDNSALDEVLSSVSDLLKTGKKLQIGGLSIVDKIMHKIACRSAIKAGDKSVAYDLEQLAERVLSDSRLRYCPHGRPICVRISKNELEKKFKRIV